MTTIRAAVVDGRLISLAPGVDLIDVTGVRWHWTGQTDADGVALLASARPADADPHDPHSHTLPTPVPVTDVHRWHGPLHPAPAEPVQRADARPTPATVFGRPAA